MSPLRIWMSCTIGSSTILLNKSALIHLRCSGPRGGWLIEWRNSSEVRAERRESHSVCAQLGVCPRRVTKDQSAQRSHRLHGFARNCSVAIRATDYTDLHRFAQIAQMSSRGAEAAFRLGSFDSAECALALERRGYWSDHRTSPGAGFSYPTCQRKFSFSSTPIETLRGGEG